MVVGGVRVLVAVVWVSSDARRQWKSCIDYVGKNSKRSGSMAVVEVPFTAAV